MANIERIFARREGKINVDIDRLWELLTDWGNMDWWGNDLEDDGMEVGKYYLEGEKGKVPRTKVLERSNAEGAGLPIINRETLLLEDASCYRLYYDATDGFITGVRNYIASWALDPLADGGCTMLISSTFDVVEPGDAKAAHTTLEAVYEMIFQGLNAYFAERKVTSSS